MHPHEALAIWDSVKPTLRILVVLAAYWAANYFSLTLLKTKLK
jgi:hypothetical protein